MREVYINADYPATQEIVWGYDGENNSSKLNIKLPDLMVGEKFVYTVHFKDALDKQSSVSATAVNGVCSVDLTKNIAVGGKLKVQVVAVSSKATAIGLHKIKVPKQAEKIRLILGNATLTLGRADSRVLSIETLGEYEAWTLNVKLDDGEYVVEAKFGSAWITTKDILVASNQQVVKTPVLTLIIKSKDGDLI